MGFALEKMSGDERAEIARSLFTVKSEAAAQGELHGLCPFHGENNPSFSYNFLKDSFNCLACDAKGDLISLWCHNRGLANDADGFKEFCAAHNIELKRGSRGKPSGAGKRSKPQDKKTEQEEKPAPIIDESVWQRMKPLPDHVRKMLREKRGWSEQVMDDLDIRLQSVYLDKKDNLVKDLHRPDRIAIPIRDDDGNLVNIRCYKLNAQVNKITSWGPGYGSSRLFPAGVKLKPGPIYLCEGEPDTLCALSRNLNATTQTSKTKTFPPDQRKHFKNRDIIICYDADGAHEGEKHLAGIEHAENAARDLCETAKSIRILEWPDYMGRLADGSWPSKHGQDLTDFFVTHNRTIDEFQELTASARLFEAPQIPENPPPAGGIRFFKKINGRWSFIPRKLANQILDDIPLMYEPLTSLLYKWNGKHWEEYHEDNLKKICINYLDEESKMSRVKDATDQARLLSTIQHGRSPNDMTDWLCLQNTMLDISRLDAEKFNTKPHARDFYATYSLNVSLQDKIIPCDRWQNFLSETIKTDLAMMQAQEFAGYCLTRETRYGKCLFLLGPGSDGKSTFLKILRKLVGEQNCAAVAFRDMEDQFYRSALYNKLLNISTEVGSRAMESMYFKAICTGDTISAAFKNKTPFDFTPFCKLAFAANKLPRVLDNSDGFFRRVLPISFKRQFFGEDEDKWLEMKLIEELDGIFQWALAGLYRLRQQGGFTWGQETDDLLLDYKRENNPVLCFVEDECILGEQCEVKKDGLYDAYSKYCDRSGYRKLSKVHFFRELAIVKKGLQETKPRIEGKRERFISGIGLQVKEVGE